MAILGVPSPLCARCTGMVIGACVTGLAALVLAAPVAPLWLAVAGAVPAAADGIRSYYLPGGTSNGLRLGTGLVLGAGLALCLR